VSGFELTATTAVATLGVELRQYLHAASGARHLHFACADTNNAFMVALPTLPADSTGVAHILEHTTLCGSRRYPVRDPFFMMLRRSLNTFMNAFTASDSTAYPFATQNRKDFDNLLDVYLDSVFFPRLDPLDFAQEGWRLERDADAGRLVLHGVVYNEMKGAMSAPVAQLWQHVQAALFPDTVYRHNSGGDPLAIPDLSHAALREFHARHYHPANAVFMTYGCFDEREHQDRIETRVLAEFSRPGVPIMSALQPRFTQPRECVAGYADDAGDEPATHIVWAWLLGEAADPEQLVRAQVLSSILLEHSASPLRHFLETSELANAPSELCGVDDSARQLVFVCGVEGSDRAHAEALERDIFGVLDRVARDGLDAAALAAIVDRIEMAQRDLGGGSYPFGLQLMGRVMPAAMYRRDPARLLDLEPVLADLRAAIASPDWVKRLVRDNLLDNTHRVRVVMQPDATSTAQAASCEHARLESLAAQMDATALAGLDRQAEALRARQAAVDDPDILPRVSLVDVPAAIAQAQAYRPPVADIDAYEYACGANGIFRVQVIYDIPRLAVDELTALPLFADYLTEFGCADQDYLAVQARRALAGSFHTHVMARAPLAGGAPRGWLVIAGKGLARKRDVVIDTVGDMLASVRFDEVERLRELLMQSRAEVEQSLTDRGHQLALATAACGFGASAALDELWDGPSAVCRLKELATARGAQQSARKLFEIFARLRAQLLTAPRRVVLIGEDSALAGATARATFIGRGSALSAPDIAAALPQVSDNKAWMINAQVNFCAKAYAAVAEAHADAAVLSVLGRYLQDGFLHGAIREHGGAYGAGAAYDADSATFRFFSYRDPRGGETLDDFDRALDWFAGERDQQRLEESILGTIRALDQPRSPAGEAERAITNVLFGRDDAARARFRAQVLAADHATLHAVAARYLEPARGAVGVVCGTEHKALFAGRALKFAKL
jgi:Zn-dependent M16 (insulinase) family peptidase